MFTKKILFFPFLVLIIAGIVGWFVFGKNDSLYETKYERESVQVRFDMEIFDKILENYWQKIEEADLAELFRFSLAKVASSTEVVLSSNDRGGIAKALLDTIEKIPEDEKKELALNTGVIVLANLAPQGRNGLLSDKEEIAFRNDVNNINPETGQAEPTLSYRTLSSGTLYVDLSKISATTIQEVAELFSQYSATNTPAGLILDIRGNAGGALDFARYFFSMFIGPNQYVYDYFHQGELKPERTPAFNKLEMLSKVKNIAVLTDENTQSTSELLASIFKRFRLAKIVGMQTKGWGTVENTFPLETNLGDGNKYSILLVHSLTLREDGEPIEGRGIDPDINLKNANWRQQLTNAFQSSAFVNDLAKILSK